MGITAEPHKPPKHLLHKGKKKNSHTKPPCTEQTSTQSAL